jgi:hypothetical protein
MNKFLIKKIFCIAVISISTHTFANKVVSVENKPDSPAINQEMTLAFKFEAPESAIKCGIQIDWGDGENSKLRFGADGNVKPPFEVKHTYKTAGNAQISIKGVTVFRGMNSVGGCEANFNGAIAVVDPVEVEKIAKAKVEAEAQRQQKRDQLLALVNDPKASLADKLAGACYISSEKDYAWATGGAPMDSCDERVIQRRIKEQYAVVTIIKYLPGNQLISMTIPNVGNSSMFSTRTLNFTTKNNLITADYAGKGCFAIDELEVEIDRITTGVIGVSGNCSDVIKSATQRLVGKKNTFKLIRN